MSDIFQEVEEDVRRERYEQLWKKYGNHVIGAAAVLVIAVGGWQAWTAYDNNRRRAVSDQYEAAQKAAGAGKAADAEQERLEAFVKNPPPHATVVFVCGSLDQRRRLVKLLLKEAQVVDCGTIADAADAERWVKARAERDKVPLEPAAVRTLVERAGINIVRLRSGLERVMLYAMGQSKISAEDVRQVVPATGEATNFGIANAIEQNDAAEALRELTLALDGGAQPFFLMGQLRWVAEKMPRARLKAAIDAVFRTDEAIKSSGGDPKVLLERLVVELCGPAKAAPSGRGGRL